ncbi:sushi, von Willebrand factor type A, EGF and pentraxin domain-containing protein 1-like [Dysidea avara]|uniref:sushi, von Willebrand factor type A, EGF and pentraxin domain-containing protein 1-like n=1 Tax=Dysidea avara TaxID=196820 RepID=UPI00331782BC
MKGALIIIFLTILAVTLAQQPFWVATLTAKCQSSGEKSCCLGAIISDDCLITAASCFSHCAQNDSLSIKATALQYSTSGKSMRIKVVKDGIIIHPDYATSQAADLALVKFETPKFILAKATISDNCRQIYKADDLSVINVINKKTITNSPIQKDENKKCKNLYKPNWQGSTQTCFNTSACAEKPGSFIEDDNTLYAMTTFGCMQGSNTIAALSICKYYEWINNQFTTPTGPTSQSTTPTSKPTIPTSKPTNPPTTPSTTPGCPPPLEIQNGVVQYDSTTDGSVARYQCNEGYTMRGNKKIKCVGIEWNRNPPKCASSQPTKPPTTPSTQQPTPIRLPQPVPMCNNPPTVSKALIDIPDTLEEGAVATYTCATRYGLVGDKQLTCKNGKWTGVVPSCQDCPPFKLRNGNFRIVETSVFLYATNLKCNKGYQLNGGGVNYCEHGKWKFPLQMCTIKQCPIPEDIPIGSVRHNNPPVHGSLAVYSCPTGYAVSGFQKRLCSDGKWEGFPPKCVSNKKRCPQYESLQCGTTSNSGGTKAGATVTYTPLPNFMLIGPSVITCQPNGTWSSPMPKCRRMCPMDFNLENGDHELIMDDMKIEYDMILTCDKGFIMKGLKQFTCTELGVWNRIPSQTKCDKVCTCLDVNNGDATCQEIGDFLFAYVTCKRGYKLQGSSPAICEKGAYFSTPKCVRK